MSEDGFLDRWSRLKRAAAEPPPAPPEATEPAPAEAVSEITAEEHAALPPVEEATVAADLVGYLRRGVPAALQRTAMRRMWVLNPAIRDYVDPAQEYAYNWNVPGGVPGGGAPPSAEQTKAMVDRLFARLVPREPAPPDVPEAPAEELPKSAEAPVEQAPPAAAEAAPPADQPRRRHGGATPV
jgi:hypothetical protein